MTKYLKIYDKYMQTTFIEKKNKLLDDLRILALKHNRDYYTSIIPYIIDITEAQEDILNLYSDALQQDAHALFSSRKAFVTPNRIESLL